MKKILVSLAALLVFGVVQAQIETKIIGKWKVSAVESSKDSKLNNKEEKQLKSLQKASLEFRADGHAKFKQVLSGFHIPDGYWRYEKNKDVIIISEWDNRKVDLMRLWYDEEDDGSLKFYIDETPFVISVIRE
ncbi:MAG: hypothetical protein LBR81_02425 [Prevotellaceae bacterium]|jgi:hypothetical protein|nr:hypothetical protein [Prevotellaceae bacterium]